MSTVLQDIVAKKHYKFIDGAGLTWQDAVKISTESLIADGSVSADFYKQIIACIEKYGPYMVFEHNVAMPHTTENAEGVYKTGIGFMVCKNLIDFGTDEDGEKKDTYRVNLSGRNMRAQYVRVSRKAGVRKDFFHLNKILVYGTKFW